MGTTQELIRGFYGHIRTNAGENGSRAFRRRLNVLAATGSTNILPPQKIGVSDRHMLSLLQMIGTTITDGVEREQFLHIGEMQRVRRLLGVAEGGAYPG